MNALKEIGGKFKSNPTGIIAVVALLIVLLIVLIYAVMIVGSYEVSSSAGLWIALGLGVYSYAILAHRVFRRSSFLD